MSGNDLLPPEILTLIFVGLPVKSILRCRCVCKTWYSLISCPDFISPQTLKQSPTNRVLLLRWELATGLRKFSSHDESFVESHDLPDPLRSPGVGIVGHCNGLICFSRRPDKAQSFLIWNPSIRKSVELPMPSSPRPSMFWYLSGFGFDPESSDYKVLRTVVAKLNLAGLGLVESQILDLRKGVWRSLSHTIRPAPYNAPHSCTYLNGVLHWIREDGIGTTTECTLLFFNLSTEVFLEMDMPFDLKQPDDRCDMLFPIKGLLSVALLSGKQDWCSVWSMKECAGVEYGGVESWSKLFHIELPSTLLKGWLFLVCCWENGEVLLVDSGERNVWVSYNPESRESKVLSPSEPISTVCYYTETLALL